MNTEHTDRDARIEADLVEDRDVWHRGGPFPADEGPSLGDLTPPF